MWHFIHLISVKQTHTQWIILWLAILYSSHHLSPFWGVLMWGTCVQSKLPARLLCFLSPRAYPQLCLLLATLQWCSLIHPPIRLKSRILDLNPQRLFSITYSFLFTATYPLHGLSTWSSRPGDFLQNSIIEQPEAFSWLAAGREGPPEKRGKKMWRVPSLSLGWLRRGTMFLWISVMIKTEW